MIVITDSNIIFSALISPNGTVAQILKAKSRLQFFAPSYLFEEVNRHLAKIEELSPLNIQNLDTRHRT
ncbi:PIN domain-containing protein [Parapedobacter sp. GCM10030251]|uniref:PIN domain-containing protein n=1 Tax=Parapedobacter sp. GCM10030251 TaxID=3273419 RepID=UPI00360CB76E